MVRSFPAFAAVLALSACGSEGSSQGTVRLVGRVGSPTAPFVAGSAVSALNGGDVLQVIALRGDAYEVRDVVDGEFAFELPTDRTVSLVLVGAGEAYLGFVSVRGTIPGIPLQAVDDGVSTVDLGTLVESGSIVSPGEDPIGRTITLDDGEIAALSEMGVFARTMLEDPDVDDDGRIDLLQNREYRPQIGILREGTMNGTSFVVPTSVSRWTFGINVAEPGVATFPDTATFAGPAGAGIDAVVVSGRLGGFSNVLYEVPLPTPELAPPAGSWTLAYGTRNLGWMVPDLTGVAASAPVLVPAVSVDAAGVLESISWVWRMPDGTVRTEKSNLAVVIKIQVNADPPAQPCPASDLGTISGDIVYGMRESVDVTSHRLACQDIPFSAVSAVSLAFTDVFGGEHTAYYRRP